MVEKFSFLWPLDQPGGSDLEDGLDEKEEGGFCAGVGIKNKSVVIVQISSKLSL